MILKIVRDYYAHLMQVHFSTYMKGTVFNENVTYQSWLTKI